VNAAVEDGIACDSGDFCDGQEVCQSGICVGGLPPCTSTCGQCNESTDTCDWCRFDLDGSEWIAGGDFGIFSGCFGACYPAGDPCLAGNFDEDMDGCVGGGDFGVFSGCFARTCEQCPTCFGPPSAGKNLAEPDDGSRARLALIVVGASSPADVLTRLPASRSGFAVGDVVWLELWAQGGRPADGKEEGLAAVYANLTFDHTRLALGKIVPSGQFPLFAGGTTGAADGLVEALGGCAPLGEAALGTGGTWVRVAGLQLKATSTGRAFARCDPAASPFGVAVINRFGDLQEWQVEYGAAIAPIRRAALTVPGPGEPVALEPAG
jgi:hypothetical protein